MTTKPDMPFDNSFVVQKAEQRYAERTSRKPRSFLSVESLSEGEMKEILDLALTMKKNPKDYAEVLKGQKIALLFQKTSTRTRCSFETAAVELGAYPTYMDWGRSNFTLSDLSDEVICLSRYYNLIMARVYEHATLVEMAKFSEKPVINGLCNKMHPCQAVCDYMTIMEYFGANLKGLNMTYVGDGNNVCRSLVHGAALLGVNIKVSSPEGYKLDQATVDASKGMATLVDSPAEAVQGADVVYTDTWVSMGDEAEASVRLQAFQGYQVNEELMAKAAKHALFMHCLPAHPGQEVSAGVLRAPQSVVFDEAENRKHGQKAILSFLNSVNPK